MVTESSVTVAAHIERWISATLAASDRRPSTREGYRILLRRHVVPHIGGRRLRDLTPGDVEALTLLLSESLAPSTVRQTYTALRLVLDTAERDGLVRRNVAALVDRPRVPKREAVAFTPGQVAALRAAAARHRFAPLLDLVAFTGLRIGEALALRWQDVDSDQLRVTATLTRGEHGMERTNPKTEAGWRIVPLVPEAAAALRARKTTLAGERLRAGSAWTDNGLVFTTEAGTPLDDRNALRWFHRIRAKAGIEAGSWHSLRHAAATELLQAGVPMPTVSAILGHGSITVTVDLYGHVGAGHMAEEMTRGLAGYGRPGSVTQSVT